MDISILNILMDYMRDYLYEKLVTEVTDMETALGLVKVGKLQDDPTILLRNLMIHPQSKEPDDDEHEWHTPHTKNTNQVGGIEGAYLIGGGYHAYWWRRYRLNFELFFTDEPDRDEARRKANIIISRTEQTIQNMPMPTWDGTTGELSDGTGPDDTQIDSFGESPSMVYHMGTHQREGGGEPDFIWRIEMKVHWLTEKS